MNDMSWCFILLPQSYIYIIMGDLLSKIRGGPWTGSTRVVHEPGPSGTPWTRSTGVVHGPGPSGTPWTRSTGVVVHQVLHGRGPQGWSMDQVHQVLHGPGPQGWSMDLGQCFIDVYFTTKMFTRPRVNSIWLPGHCTFL